MREYNERRKLVYTPVIFLRDGIGSPSLWQLMDMPSVAHDCSVKNLEKTKLLGQQIEVKLGFEVDPGFSN